MRDHRLSILIVLILNNVLCGTDLEQEWIIFLGAKLIFLIVVFKKTNNVLKPLSL